MVCNDEALHKRQAGDGEFFCRIVTRRSWKRSAVLLREGKILVPERLQTRWAHDKNSAF